MDPCEARSQGLIDAFATIAPYGIPDPSPLAVSITMGSLMCTTMKPAASAVAKARFTSAARLMPARAAQSSRPAEKRARSVRELVIRNSQLPTPKKLVAIGGWRLGVDR